ncbi:NAD(P)/FAD-dependent oxidoreductase [Halomonas organivorans]|uniref:Glycine/D-amino acid oxidase-like deaminating enzyme n=1 Tax=Halomonas organivorans TaxID=257772 RepID=A0A7W5BX11_9GAMM|nr:FAD-binding oxidoreductase [Halomonas organivorans]MBB3139693.1 glycine/D-amino acid oxidase-like deaminating enzyme [Halomonas organivorans]
MSQATLPRDDKCNGWYQLLDDPRPARRLNACESADWLVIGAGFTGLAAARRVAELRPGDRVVVLEALRVGQGASGRNTGFVIDLPHKRDLEGDDLERKQKLLSLNRGAVDDLEELIQRHSIGCDWSRAGKYQGAVGERGLKYLDHYERLLQEFDYPYRRLDRDELAPILGTRHYASAIYTANTALMQPAALVRGLGETLPENAALYEHTPVVGLSHSSGQWCAITPEGEVRATNLLLGSNIYAQEFGFLKHRVLPVMTFASMTRALTDDEMALFSTAPHHFGLTPADHAGTTLRLTPDRRLIVRNQYRFVPHYHDNLAERTRIRQGHRESFEARYPTLSHVPFEATWGGACGLSRNYTAFFGKVGNNAWMSGVHQSVGAARGTISGKLLAELATEQDSAQLSDMLAVSGKPALNPPEPFLSVGVKMRMKQAAWASRSEL